MQYLPPSRGGGQGGAEIFHLAPNLIFSHWYCRWSRVDKKSVLTQRLCSLILHHKRTTTAALDFGPPWTTMAIFQQELFLSPKTVQLTKLHNGLYHSVWAGPC